MVEQSAAQAAARQAESIGLIVTELVMNALKHAFPDEEAKGQITVAYDGTARIPAGKLAGVFQPLRAERSTSCWVLLEEVRLRIAQIAPLMESVPPQLYGGTERIASYLTEELVRLGHEVTLFASGDSVTASTLVPCVPRALRLDAGVRDTIPYYMLMLDRVRQRSADFDVLHFHIDQFHFPLFRPIAQRTVTTLHGRQDLPDLLPLYAGFADMPLVSISNFQRRPAPDANYVANIPHGLPVDLHRANIGPPGDYIAFLGRIAPEKRPDRAIAIARALGIPLKIAAKVDRVDEAYFRGSIAPLLEGPGVEFIGEINEQQKTRFLGGARALLFPIDWPEPFGLAMIEAMACGTPVLAFRCGSVPEIIEDGITGAIVDTIDEAIAALPRVIALDRRKVRQRFEQRFTATRMATDYVDIYRALIASSPMLNRGDDAIGPSLAADGNGHVLPLASGTNVERLPVA